MVSLEWMMDSSTCALYVDSDANSPQAAAMCVGTADNPFGESGWYTCGLTGNYIKFACDAGESLELYEVAAYTSTYIKHLVTSQTKINGVKLNAHHGLNIASDISLYCKK
jgi:hypothetical protein